MSNPLSFDPQKVWANVRQATTEDLLDRLTVYRAGMEEEALAIIEAELRSRGVGPAEVAAHGERVREVVLQGPDGIALTCSFCFRPAVAQGWGWHWLWQRVPIFPRFFNYCTEHQPPQPVEEAPD